jgi:hypothetical protein
MAILPENPMQRNSANTIPNTDTTDLENTFENITISFC